MTPEQQKQRAKEFMLALDRRDEKTLLEMMTTDFVFELMTRAPGEFEPCQDRETFLSTVLAMLRETLPNGFNFTFEHAIAEGPHVAIEARCDAVTTAGRNYKNRYHWYFRFAGDKIDRFREYLDSYHVFETYVGD